MKINHNSIKKILVIKMGGIGDVLLVTPLLNNLRDFYPNAVINVLTVLKCRDVLMDNPYIDRVLTFVPGKDKSGCLIKNIRKQKYNLVIDLFCNPRTTFLTFTSGAEYRVGFDFPRRGYAYNIFIKVRNSVGDYHHADLCLISLKELGIPIKFKETFISVRNAHLDFAENFFDANNLESKSTIGVSVSGGWESKKYKDDDYIKLIELISLRFNYRVLLVWGTEKEKKECEYIISKTRGKSIIAPKTSLRYAAALFSKCTAVIGNDSGLLHIASSIIRVLGIYGPTNPLLQGPYGNQHLTIVNENLKCLNCAKLHCPIGNICMTQLDKNLVLDKLSELLLSGKAV